MKISTRGRYALRMMLDLAQNAGDSGYVSLQAVADRQGISKKYLEQIVSLLSKSQMLLANRGFQGGYRLAKPASDYTVGDVLRVTEGSLASVPCTLDHGMACPREADCLTRTLWQGLYDTVTDYLDSVTLQQLIDGENQ